MTTLKDLLLDYAEEIKASIGEPEKSEDWLEDLTDTYITEIIERLIK